MSTINVNDNNNINWIDDFLTGKSGLSKTDETIKELSRTISESPTLQSLVKDRYLSGTRFMGWTTNGSNGYTDVSSGHIYIKQGTGKESITLGYECINSTNKNLFEKIGIMYASLSTTQENRDGFARDLLGVEAQAMYVKCELAKEMDKREFIRDHYLQIADDSSLTKSGKIGKLKQTMIAKGRIHNGEKSAYDTYRTERYDDFVAYYRGAMSN